ncbi:FACT complex subunit spt16 [Microbotryomycetes sp. JL221]|nr:FACT complex subunit spt16 [Microbotryomycetes sp. JL221]
MVDRWPSYPHGGDPTSTSGYSPTSSASSFYSLSPQESSLAAWPTSLPPPPALWPFLTVEQQQQLMTQQQQELYQQQRQHQLELQQQQHSEPTQQAESPLSWTGSLEPVDQHTGPHRHRTNSIASSTASSSTKSRTHSTQTRNVPCTRCRNARRSCVWPTTNTATSTMAVCQRCQKLNVECSGPLKRPPKQISQTLQAYKRNMLPNVVTDASTLSIVPSSTSHTMATQAMSYSLSYHLVNTFLGLGKSVGFMGIDSQAFAERFRTSRGRATALDDDSEMLASIYMIAGAQLSNHSSIVGSSTDLKVPQFGTFHSSAEVPNIAQVGRRRRPALTSLRQQLKRRLETLTFDDEDSTQQQRTLSQNVDRLAICWMAGDSAFLGEFDPERHLALGRMIIQGSKLLNDKDCHGDMRDKVLLYLQGIAREELRASYSMGLVSAITLDMSERIFGPPSPPPPLPPLLNEHKQILFFQKETSPQELHQIFEDHGLAVEAFYDSLAHLLIFSHSSQTCQIVETCWKALEHVERYLQHWMRGIVQDERFQHLSKELQGRRPLAFVQQAWQEELLGSLVLWGCHHKLMTKGDEPKLLFESEQRLKQSLCSIARGVGLMNDLPLRPIGMLLTMERVCLAVEHFRGPLLEQWVKENPVLCQTMLDGLKFASFGLDDASRLVEEIESLLVQHHQAAHSSTTEVDDLAARIVQSALQELSDLSSGGETDSVGTGTSPAGTGSSAASVNGGLGDVVISVSTFHRRAAKLFKDWAAKDEDAVPLNEVDWLLVVAGNSDEENPYRKGSALQTYLLGYEFPSTLMLLGNHKIFFVVSSSKAKLLQPLKTPPADQQDHVQVEILIRTKDDSENKALFMRIIDLIGDGNKVGTLPKDKMAGKFVTEWQNVVESSGKDMKQVDVAQGVSTLMASKEPEEIKMEQHAAKMTNKLMSHFSDAMSDAIDNGTKITHEQLGEQIEQKLEDNKFWKKQNLGDGFETGFGDWCYSPIIQSGGNYDLKSSAQTDDQRLKAGVILCSLGIRYKSYCSNVGRTFMIDPHSTQDKNYLYLIELQKFVVNELKTGTICKDVYIKTLEKIQTDREDLVQYFVKTCGFAMGLEFRDSAYTLGPKCTRKIKDDMIFSVSLGFHNIPDPKKQGQTYAINLIDTVKTSSQGGKILSEGMKDKDEVMFFMEDDEEETKPKKSKSSGRDENKAPSGVGGRGNKNSAPTAVVKSKLRNETRELDADSLNRRKQHQRELAARRQEQGLERFAEGGGVGGQREKQWRRFESYARDNQLPESVGSQKIVVDARKNTVVLPINGFAVPFHINTLKSLIKQEEGDFTVLRFMFTTPGAITGKKEDTPFEDPTATFIRGVTYRSTDSFRFTELHKEINDLKKAAVKREAERKEMADVVEQDRLVEVKGKRPIRLTDVQVRPSFDGKRQSGDVEIHSNGIRYQSSLKNEQKIDILFSNMKHLLFQPCDNELIVILHIHLKNPILIGKKKAKDVQFFREVSDASFDETGNKKRRKNYHDEDELEAEQDERRRRTDLNKYFKAFSDKIAEAADGRFEVDIPFRELGFNGVPFRSNVLLQPTTDALVFLTEPPFLVLSLAEIEIAHLERVQYGLKNFDMVFVFQDFARTPIHVNTIPMNQLDNVKEWLDSVDIPYSEGPVNLNWVAIMKTVNENPYEFFKEGGWGFLQDQEDEQGSSDESDEESEFNASDVESGDEDEDSESEFDDDASDDDDESGSDAADDVSADDWSEAEEKLVKKDKERQANGKQSKYDSASEDEKPKKTKSKSKK